MSGVFLYGAPGSGKSHLAKWLADYRDFKYIEGDSYLPEDMLEALQRGHGFNSEQRDRFTKILIEVIDKNQDAPLAVAQAMLLRRNRDMIKAAYPDLCFILVTANESVVQERLSHKKNLVDQDLGTSMRSLLEVDFNDPVLDTSSGPSLTEPSSLHPSIIQSLDSILQSYSPPISKRSRSSRIFYGNSISPP